jgi:tetratricopeptide (TPR) repeat protein
LPADILSRLVTLATGPMQPNPPVLIVEGVAPESGESIAAALLAHLSVAWTARCQPDLLHPFYGLSELLEQVYREADAAGLASLADPHWIALPLLAPSLAGRISPHRPEACYEYRPGDKRRRAGPEWTRRCFHGAIDFLFAVQDALGRPALAIGFLSLNQAGPEVHDFFTLLVRRSKGRHLALWATTQGAATPALLQPIERAGSPVERHDHGDPFTPPAPLSDEIPVATLAATADHFAYHGPWRDVLRLSQLALIRMQESDRPLLPSLLGVMRVALNGVNQFPSAEQLLLHLLAESSTRFDRVVCLYHLTIVHSLWQDHLDRATFYQAEAFRTVGGAPTQAERAELMIFAIHSALIVWGRQGQMERALTEGERAMAEFLAHWDPEHQRVQQAILLYGIAQAAEARGNDLLAVDYFRRSLEADPHFPEYYHHYAAALNRLDRYAEALAVCQEGAERTPPYHWLAMCRGRALQGLGRSTEALADFDRAIELEPEIPEHHFSRALLCHEQGALPEAIHSYTTYLTLRPTDAEALANRGSALHDQGHPEAALTDLDQAVAQNPGLIAALANRAAVLVDLGRAPEARADLERALALDPGNELLLQNRDALTAMLAH